MNKNVLILGFIALILLTFINIKTYLNNKNILKENLQNKIEFEKKAKTIIVLKEKLKNKTYLLKDICNISYNHITCKNLDKNKFSKLNYAIKYLNIKKLNIEKNKNSVNIKMEIE
ncbi:hypothetical protein FE773_00205 [Caminibacter mediatlanticus TB-2]|uniref:Uncharacterized protein n=1 Tax=Caminibacter mediatlanticus TB-2 TaxID=391592 RepID=A0AAI9F2B6_9BACT|nr:hypothetical protein [Caminibacter mediatlanticus]EDM23421.1 hypothetical protein CMTB2_09155 [Caminibacter mediatlanticus TB-2]QCT93664.1 hypothetical protein FE773_00205 [Caminibacter mediatlanticus TB-2]